jgi:hypothetical protein
MGDRVAKDIVGVQSVPQSEGVGGPERLLNKSGFALLIVDM